jgi:hypothetical protein
MNAMFLEPLNNADMRPTARRSRAERQADRMPDLSIHGATLHRARKMWKSQIISSL